MKNVENSPPIIYLNYGDDDHMGYDHNECVEVTWSDEPCTEIIVRYFNESHVHELHAQIQNLHKVNTSLKKKLENT